MKTAQRPCPKWHPQPLRSSSAVLSHMAPSALAIILCTLPHGLLGNSPLLTFAPMLAWQKVSMKMHVGCCWAHARKIQWQMGHHIVKVTNQKSLHLLCFPAESTTAYEVVKLMLHSHRMCETGLRASSCMNVYLHSKILATWFWFWEHSLKIKMTSGKPYILIMCPVCSQ